jgi:hypothetical protein
MMTYKLSKSLYMLTAIQKAVAAYSALAEFSVQEEEHEIVIAIENINETYKNILADAFLNHVLFESINSHRQNSVDILNS